MLDTGWFKTLPGTRPTKDTKFSREGKKSEVVLVIGQRLNNLHHFYPTHPGRPLVFLGTCHLTGMASGAVFIIDQKTVLGWLTHFFLSFF
jgi:hypothetical protein